MPPVSPSRALRRPLLLMSGLCAVGVAARYQAVPPAAPAQPPVTAPMVAPDSTAKAMPDSAMPMDSAAVDSLAAAPMATVTMAPEMTSAAPTSWPVDPATGQTLINGEPVVGRVFIMQKTDGTVKIADVAAALRGEPPAPAAAVVGGTGPAPLTATRRMRGVMIQATLWDADHKRSAVRHRMYAPSVTGAELGQQ
ncbi:MAG: hypothetical protein LCH84_14900 [Gemmatimonadetes bacterium]|nr:hypothetical protein [Gemmatimonadota bacterium]